MDVPSLADDFRDFLVALADEGVEFVLVGGYALAWYGHARATDDLDVFVRPTPANGEKIFRALAAFGAPIDAHSVGPFRFAREGYGYCMGSTSSRASARRSVGGAPHTPARTP